MNFKQFSISDNQWHDIPHYIHKTATDTLTTLPAVLYPNDTSITLGIKGNTIQNGTPTPDSPITPSECGERTKNYFDKTTSPVTIYPSTPTIANSSNAISVIIPVEPNTTYTFSKSEGNRNRFCETETIPTQGSAANNYINADKENLQTITTGSTTHYILWWVGYQQNYNTIAETIQVETGSEATEFEPYGFKIPISSAGQTTPVYLGEVQTERKIQKLVLTGEENWKLSSTIDIFYIDEILGAIRGDVLCTHFAGVDSFSGNNQITVSQSLRINIRTNYVSHNLTDWTNYLAQQYANGTPVTVWYVLATPQTTTVNEPLMKIGDYADSLTTSIPCTAGENTLDVQTTVQPSEVTAGFSGWHPVTDVHERENGQWD